MTFSSAHLPAFRFLVVLDFEATCDEGKFYPQEIIEWPAIIIDMQTSNILIQKQFHYYIKPVIHPELTPFCTKLTGITQLMVDNGHTIQFVSQKWNEWCFANNLLFSFIPHFFPHLIFYNRPSNNGTIEAVIITHGDWDLKSMWKMQCSLSSSNADIKNTTVLLHSWINLKHVFRAIYPSYNGSLGMMKILKFCNIKHVGRHHSGIDDVRNICNIALYLYSQQKKKKISKNIWRKSFYDHRLLSTDIDIKQSLKQKKKSINILSRKELLQLSRNSGRKPMSKQASKTCSWILRHGAKKVGLNMSADGFVSMKKFLQLKDIQKHGNIGLSDIIQMVIDDKKERFCLAYAYVQHSKEFYIRCNQGHSLSVIESDELLTKLSVNDIQNNYQSICHGTFHKFMKSILNSGLKRMTRKHIHFACNDCFSSLTGNNSNKNQMKSGMRYNCEILIYVDVIQCILDGIHFYRSLNNVILTEGDVNGCISNQYFIKIVRFTHGKPGEIIWKPQKNINVNKNEK